MEDSMILTEDLINNGDDNTTTNNDQMMDLLQQSPFAPLLEIDGVTPETLINSFATAFGDSDSSVDASLFAINAATGALSFIAAPDFEDASDSDKNNQYEIQIS